MKLEARGITVDASLTADWAKNLAGGAHTDGYNFGDLLNASLTLDTDLLFHWKGGTMDHEWLFWDSQDFMKQLGLAK